MLTSQMRALKGLGSSEYEEQIFFFMPAGKINHKNNFARGYNLYFGLTHIY